MLWKFANKTVFITFFVCFVLVFAGNPSFADVPKGNPLKKQASAKKTVKKQAVKKAAPEKYTIKKGDSLYAISKRYKVKTDDLMAINGLNSTKLKPGQILLLKGAPKVSQLSAAKAEQVENNLKTIANAPDISMKDRLIAAAGMMVDIPYRFGGSSLNGIDCSAFVQKVFGFADIMLPRAAREQFKQGVPVEKEELAIGDLVFFRTYASFPSHVGIYVGNNLFIHASSKVKKVTVDSLDLPYYIKRFIGAKRLLTDSISVNPEPRLGDS